MMQLALLARDLKGKSMAIELERVSTFEMCNTWQAGRSVDFHSGNS